MWCHRIKSAFGRGRLIDISPLGHPTEWNPLASTRADDTHQSATRQCEISKTIGKKGDAKIDLTFPWTITEVEPVAVAVFVSRFFLDSDTARIDRINIYSSHVSLFMQIAQPVQLPHSRSSVKTAAINPWIVADPRFVEPRLHLRLDTLLAVLRYLSDIHYRSLDCRFCPSK